MRWTICYGMMFVSLGSMLAYTMVEGENLRDPFNDMFGRPRAFVQPASGNQSPIVIAPATTTAALAHATPVASASTETPSPAPPAAITSTPTVTPGMSTAEITAAFGEPDMISDDGNRWTYGYTVLIFNDEGRLSGSVGFDPVQAAINRYQNVIASIETDEDAATSSPKTKTGPRVLTRSNSSYAPTRYYGKGNQYRTLTAASSRDAYRYNAYGQEYSYYMNRYGPMDRTFTRKPSLPRGMSSAYDRNMSRAYQPFGNRSRYGVSPNIEYRR
jgi:hypothetical protein